MSNTQPQPLTATTDTPAYPLSQEEMAELFDLARVKRDWALRIAALTEKAGRLPILTLLCLVLIDEGRYENAELRGGFRSTRQADRYIGWCEKEWL